MNVILNPIGSIKPYENNPRNNDKSVSFVKNCIREFGFRVPIIIDKDNIIVCGHTRLKAAIELEMSEVPCIIADDLSEKQVMEYRIADNAVAEIAIWDKVLLSKEMADFAEIKPESFIFEQMDADKTDFDSISTEIEPQETSSFFTVVFNDKTSRDIFQAFMRYAKKVHPDLSKEVALLVMLESELNE
jgi:hypothetical protein